MKKWVSKLEKNLNFQQEKTVNIENIDNHQIKWRKVFNENKYENVDQ